ncbi:MAG: peptidoglycan/xylan/chitin deacetylase (PgdA/CDA1 family) [Cyclobacteriaceae bacterium]|jgi:peptidoglycan/xylan/chitin deacetylase (PgdA/CDA1 family)
MRYYFYRTPSFLKKIYPGVEWRIPTNKNEIFLTFDDGPVPIATPYVLDVLADYQAKATFFVVGENAANNLKLMDRIVSEGHRLGNHTYNHLKGWRTAVDQYLDNVKACDEVMPKLEGGKPLFRPPYGRITFKQAAEIQKTHRVIMWELLSGDFDRSLNVKSASGSLLGAKSGDILVFHDSLKYLDNVKKLLPEFLDKFSENSTTFSSIPS